MLFWGKFRIIGCVLFFEWVFVCVFLRTFSNYGTKIFICWQIGDIENEVEEFGIAGYLWCPRVQESQSPRVYKGVPEAEAWPDTAKLPPQTLPSMGGGHIHCSPSDFRGLVSLGFGESDHALPKPTEVKSNMFWLWISYGNTRNHVWTRVDEL